MNILISVSPPWPTATSPWVFCPAVVRATGVVIVASVPPVEKFTLPDLRSAIVPGRLVPGSTLPPSMVMRLSCAHAVDDPGGEANRGLRPRARAHPITLVERHLLGGGTPFELPFRLHPDVPLELLEGRRRSRRGRARLDGGRRRRGGSAAPVPVPRAGGQGQDDTDGHVDRPVRNREPVDEVVDAFTFPRLVLVLRHAPRGRWDVPSSFPRIGPLPPKFLQP